MTFIKEWKTVSFTVGAPLCVIFFYSEVYIDYYLGDNGQVSGLSTITTFQWPIHCAYYLLALFPKVGEKIKDEEIQINRIC